MALLSGSTNQLLTAEEADQLPAFSRELDELTTVVQNYAAFEAASQSQRSALAAELETTRRTRTDLSYDDDEVVASLRSKQEEASHLRVEVTTLRLAEASTDTVLRGARTRIQGLLAQRDRGPGWTLDQLDKHHALDEQRCALQREAAREHSALIAARAACSALAEQREAATRARVEADKATASVREELHRARGRVNAAARAKEAADAEQTEAHDLVEGLRATLAERSATVETGASEVEAIQDALRRDRAALESCIRECDRLRTRSTRTSTDLEMAVIENAALGDALHEASEKSAQLTREASRRRQDVDKLLALEALAAKKIGETEAAAADAQARLDGMRSALEEQRSTEATAREAAAAQTASAADARREHDTLLSGMERLRGSSRLASDAALAADGTLRGLRAEAGGYKAAVGRLRLELAGVQRELDRYTGSCEEASQGYFTAIEAVKLQELQISALTRKASQAAARMKNQQGLYDALKADRSRLVKQLEDAQTEATTLQRAFRSRALAIEKLKDDITSKDNSLLKEHFEHHKVEREKEGLRNEVTRLQKQITGCTLLLTQQATEATKLGAIVSEAEAECVTQAREVDAITAERALLHAQLVKRDKELAVLYERLRVQRSGLASGAQTYGRAVEARDALAARVAALKGQYEVATANSTDSAALAAEARALEEELTSARAKLVALESEAGRPINVHRWHALSERDPVTWALILRVHSLQRRLLETRDEGKSRGAALRAAQGEVSLLKKQAARAAVAAGGPDSMESIAASLASLKAKGRQISTLEAELVSARVSAAALREESALINGQLASLGDAYMLQFRSMRATAAPKGKRRAAAAQACGEAIAWGEHLDTQHAFDAAAESQLLLGLDAIVGGGGDTTTTSPRRPKRKSMVAGALSINNASGVGPRPPLRRNSSGSGVMTKIPSSDCTPFEAPLAVDAASGVSSSGAKGGSRRRSGLLGPTPGEAVKQEADRWLATMA